MSKKYNIFTIDFNLFFNEDEPESLLKNIFSHFYPYKNINELVDTIEKVYNKNKKEYFVNKENTSVRYSNDQEVRINIDVNALDLGCYSDYDCINKTIEELGGGKSLYSLLFIYLLAPFDKITFFDLKNLERKLTLNNERGKRWMKNIRLLYKIYRH